MIIMVQICACRGCFPPCAWGRRQSLAKKQAVAGISIREANSVVNIQYIPCMNMRGMEKETRVRIQPTDSAIPVDKHTREVSGTRMGRCIDGDNGAWVLP